MPVSLPTTCLRCGSDHLTWTYSRGELPHVECGHCLDDYRVLCDGDRWTMVDSRLDRIAEFYRQLRRVARRQAQRIRNRDRPAVDAEVEAESGVVPFTPWDAIGQR